MLHHMIDKHHSPCGPVDGLSSQEDGVVVQTDVPMVNPTLCALSLFLVTIILQRDAVVKPEVTY